MSEERAVYLIEKIIYNNLEEYCENDEEKQVMTSTLEKMIKALKEAD